jgi:UDP-glucose:(heptosyl)LPS alpha-1,3-glucosyltransferase
MEKWHSHLDPRRRLFAAVEKELLGNNPPVVPCLSDYVKHSIENFYPLPADRLVTLFNAVDLQKFQPGKSSRAELGIGADKQVALMVAQDFERKGLRQALAAIAAAHDPRLLLLVVGRDKPDAYRGITEQVKFIGAVSDPLPYYRAADFFILPTRHDPCSLATLEALAMGLPVISSRFNGACEIMKDGVHGFVLPDPADVASITSAIRQINTATMRPACLELRSQLSFDAHVERLESIYDSCTSRRQNSTARVSE